MRIGVIVASLTALAGVAHADQAAPLEPISAAKGVVAKVVDVPIGATARFALIEWRDLAQDDAPTELPHWTELVPFDPKTCARFYAIVADASAWRSGQTTRGLLVPGERPRGNAPTLPWCQIRHGVAGSAALPALETIAKAEQDAVLPGLGAMLDFFGAGAKETPLDDAVDTTLRALTSDAALQFAIDRGRDWLAQDHYHWRTNPEHFDVVDRAVWAAAEPPYTLLRLYWHLSPTRAAARMRAEYAKDPKRAVELARASPDWEEALAVKAELGLSATPATPVDAATIAAYVRAHPDDDDKYDGARVRVVGPMDNGCDVTMPLAGFELRVDVDCDAENLHAMFAVQQPTTITVTGRVTDVYNGDDYQTITVEYGHAVAGGVATAPTPDVDAGPARKPRRDPPREAKKDGGCGCGAGGDGSGLALVALIAWRLRRRRTR